MRELSRKVIDYVLDEGACAAGIATTETLSGGPPSTELTQVLAGARAAVGFAVPLDQGLIPAFLGKRDRCAHERDNLRANAVATGIASHLAHYLTCHGYEAAPVMANEVYRDDTPGGQLDMMPDISLRYLAVASGVGHFGLSGNVHTPKEGAAVILGAAVTAADLAPTDPLPVDENYCDRCKLCMNACVSHMMDEREETTVRMGKEEFRYSKRGNYLRCDLVCGGFTGLHRSGKWSTWSPGRFPVPENDDDLMPAITEAVDAYGRRPQIEGGHYHVLMDAKLGFTCGNCQLICHPSKEERKRRYRKLVTSGVVVQDEDGSLRGVTPPAARKYLAAMPPERRALYEKEESQAAPAKRRAGALR